MILTRENFSDQYREKGELHVDIGSSTPFLEVLELDIHHNLAVSVTSLWWYGVKLTKLILITAGTLQLHWIDEHRAVSNILKQMYL